MSKYINADDILSFLKDVFPLDYYRLSLKAQIILLPSADVRENIHGEWIKNDNGTYSCSLCQSWIPNEQYSYARFCLHCGANMRGIIE